MFDNRWDNWAGDFADSPQASSFSSAARYYLPDILRAFGEAVAQFEPEFPDECSPGSLAAAFHATTPRLALPDALRKDIPEVIAVFFEYLGETGRMSDAAELAAAMRRAPSVPAGKARPSGGPKGVTIKRSEKVSPLGRNDPCPCGSGKKFKKCCMTQ